MQKSFKTRSPIAVLLWGFFTCGIYLWYWQVKTKGELNEAGADHIPTAWIWLIPIVGYIWWIWKYAQGVEKIVGKYSDITVFVLMYLVLWPGSAILQNSYNKLSLGNDSTVV